MTKRNIEEIRRKNLEDNQRFLKKLRMNNIRNDFVKSARSVVHKDQIKKPKAYIQYEKVERITRYSLKVKSGEIPAHVPEWQQKANKKPKGGPSKWTLLFKNNQNPYKRTYKPRIRE